MKIKYLILPICALCMLAYSYSQKPSRYENDEYVFWQPGVRLTLDDYQGNDHPENLKTEELWKAMSTENISFKMVVDYPKDSAMRGQLMEQIYLVPVFSKRTSYNLDKDTAILKYEQLYFDMAELTAMGMRKYLAGYKKTYPNAYGLHIIKMNSYQNMLKFVYRNMIDKLNRSLFFEKDDGAYYKARREIDSVLGSEIEYTTRPEDCKRFLTGMPLSREYIPFVFEYDSSTTTELMQKLNY